MQRRLVVFVLVCAGLALVCAGLVPGRAFADEPVGRGDDQGLGEGWGEEVETQQPAQREPVRRRSSSQSGGGLSTPLGPLFEKGPALLHGYSATLGVTAMAGSGDFSGWRIDHAAQPTAMGFRYYERNGFISGTIFAILRVAAGAMAASGPKSVRTWEDSNYRYTETTYYSSAEKKAIQDAASNDAARAFTRPGQSFDLEVFSRNLGGDSEGYRLNMMMGGVKGARGKSMFDFGFGFGHVKSAAAADGQFLIVDWAYVGMPFRYSYAIGPAVVYGLFEWNWVGHTRGDEATGIQVSANTTKLFTAGFPLRVGVAMAAMGRLYVDVALNTPSLTSGAVGFAGSAGLRF